MSLIALAAPVWRVCDFCLIFVPFGHYDEPEILPYEIPLICSIGADVRQYYTPRMTRDEVLLIKGWDTVDDGRAQFTPHSAFELPSTDDTTPPRESIELRALVIIE